ncbi:MAG: 5-dehydro-2-deoxygluconokinase [Acidimicrobiales bacterium]|nr:5-dehydro-2-deoxygluconokinase [Acidimicrobiales bacterium]MDG1878245.1 5-dehydro-2-deoxygluconokinase [Acidimicrobiales bacterium]
MSSLGLLSIGRVSVDLYAEQIGVSMSDVTTFRKSVGGTATNVAVATARYGHHVALATRVGDDQFGRYIAHALEHTFNVDPRFITTHPTLKTPLAFAELDPPEDPTIFFYREPAAPDMEIETTAELLAAVDEARIFWVPASRFAFTRSRVTVTGLLERRARRTHTVLDLDWRAMFWASEAEAHDAISPMLDHVSIAIGNRKECEVAVGTDDPDEAADRLLERGLEAVIVKLGGEGVMVATAAGRERLMPNTVEVVCGLGAGDAFGGAFCHGLLQSWSLPDAVRYGNAAGAIVAARMMCADDMPTGPEVDAFLGERDRR